MEDITLRALRILKEVDQIACEDTRHTLKLLNHFEIHRPLVSYHEHNEFTRAPELVLAMEQGACIALVSDAGMPLVSDPGHRLVTLCIRHHISVVPIPGPFGAADGSVGFRIAERGVCVPGIFAGADGRAAARTGTSAD